MIEIIRLKMEEEKAHQKKRLLLVDTDPKFIRARMEQLKDKYDVESTVNSAEALERLQHENFDAVAMDLKLDDINGLDIIKALKRDQKPVGVIVVTSEKDPNRIHQVGQLISGLEFIHKSADFPDSELEELIEKQCALKKLRERKLPQDEIIFTSGTEELVTDTYPVYLLGGDFWERVLREKGEQGSLQSLEFRIMPRVTFRGDARIIGITTKVSGKDEKFVTLKNTRHMDESKREAAVYEGCRDARTVKYYGSAENSYGFNLVLETHEQPTLNYIMTAIAANIKKMQKDMQDEKDEKIKQELCDKIAVYNKRKHEIIEKAIETIAINNARRTINESEIEKAYQKLTKPRKLKLTNYSAEDKRHRERLETYLKDIMLWKARDFIFDEGRRTFKRELIDNFDFAIDSKLFARIKELYNDVILDRDTDKAYYFMNQGDMWLHNLVLGTENGNEVVKDFDLKRYKSDVLGWDAVEFLVEHALNLSYDEIDQYYDKFLANFVNEYMQYSDRKKSADNDLENKCNEFKDKFGINHGKTSIKSVEDFDPKIYETLKQYSFLLRQILRLRKIDAITETRFMRVELDKYYTKDFTDPVLGEFKNVDPTNYLGQDFAGIECYYDFHLEKMKEEIDIMIGEQEHPPLSYKLDQSDIDVLKAFKRTFMDFKYSVGLEHLEINLWKNKCYVWKNDEKVEKTEYNFDKIVK